MAAVTAAFAFGAATPAFAQTASDFTDWTAADAAANTASGSVIGVPVALSGSDVQGGAVLNNTFAGFSGASFTPALPTSDVIPLGSLPGYSYTLTFGSPVTNPVLHLASLATKLVFTNATSVSKVSGQPNLMVAGTTVTGAIEAQGSPNNDANGTVRVNGTFTTLPFTAEPVPGAPNGDGFFLQVGVARPAAAGTPTPVPTTTPGGTPPQPVTCQEYARNQPTDASLEICMYRVARGVSDRSVELFAAIDAIRKDVADMLPDFRKTADLLSDVNADRRKASNRAESVSGAAGAILRKIRIQNGTVFANAVLKIAYSLKVQGVGE